VLHAVEEFSIAARGGFAQASHPDANVVLAEVREDDGFSVRFVAEEPAELQFACRLDREGFVSLARCPSARDDNDPLYGKVMLPAW
jgi:hypothetical protein